MTRTRKLSLRMRLTLSYTVGIMVVLGVYAVAVLAFVSNAASRNLDDSLREDLVMSRMAFFRLPDGGIVPTDENSVRENRRWWQVWNPSGKLMYQSLGAQVLPVPESDQLAALADE